MHAMYPLHQAIFFDCMICFTVRKYLYSALFNRVCDFFCTVVQNVHSFVPKTNKIIRNDDDLPYNHARQSESWGIGQTMDSRVTYRTQTRLRIVLYTSRVSLFAVLCQRADGWWYDERDNSFTRNLRTTTTLSTRTTSNVFSFSYIYTDGLVTSVTPIFQNKNGIFRSRWLPRRRCRCPIPGEQRRC